MQDERLKLLKSLRLLNAIPDKDLAPLEEFLRPLTLKDGAVVFEEGSTGQSLYFISSGNIRISKYVSGAIETALAILGSGDCFGEMAAIEDAPRSARAAAKGPAVIFELKAADLKSWLKSRPELAMGFFSGLVLVQSQRLRRTSNELTLLFDLSQLFLNSSLSTKDLLAQSCETITSYLEGSWSAAAFLYNAFNEEMDCVTKKGAYDFSALSAQLPKNESRNFWITPDCFYVGLPGLKSPQGYLLFHPLAALGDDEKNDIDRTLTTVARLLASALENIDFRTEEILRARLKSAQSHDSRL